MEGSGTGIGRLDCYEDMFKEITRKLYGEDPDHRTSSVQNEFETVSFKTEVDNENGTDSSDDGNWVYEEDSLKGTDGSRIAAYHAGKSTWRCYECGECMTGGPREVAEHFMDLHSSRIIGDDSRNRHHSPRKDYLQSEVKLEDVLAYLEKVRDRAERLAPPLRRTQETQTVPATLLPVTSTFLLQELPSATSPQHLHQSSSTMSPSGTPSSSGKRYTCPYCPYGTDRRDLYTRHENIHREEKPFHCYVCFKPFNRADHVKKHFLRMHREHTYELSRIRRPTGTTSTTPKTIQQDATAAANGTNPQHNTYPTGFNNNKGYQLQTNPASAGNVYQTPTVPTTGIVQSDANCSGRRLQNGGCNSKSHLKGGSKGAQERRYTCCYCSWSGVDNWCLKRHLNTHLKPFACTLCEYKAARAERLSTHVLKVHNRRQCSRCTFLAEDAAQLQVHQLHVHRVSNASAPASVAVSSPAVTAPPQPQNNRHQQTLHPIGNGRPPPGPPVFPAPAPAIAPTTTTVIPPSTILGHEMVNSPAAAATLESFRDEGRESPVCKQSSCNEDVFRLHRGTRSLSPGLEKCRSHDDNDDSNDSFHCSDDSKTGPIEASKAPMVNERRSRKQRQPRKVMSEEQSDVEEENMLTDIMQDNCENMEVLANPKSDENSQGSPKKFYKCDLCNEDSAADGSVSTPYHTKASLILHAMSKHHYANMMNESISKYGKSRSHEITLKATLFTNASFNHQR